MLLGRAGLEILRRRPRRLLGVEAFVDPVGAVQPVFAPGGRHELPQPGSPGVAIGLWNKSTLDHREVFQLVRDPFLAQDLLEHGKIHRRPADPAIEMLLRRALQVRDALLDEVISLERDRR